MYFTIRQKSLIAIVASFFFIKILIPSGRRE
jgi:hypothetical protein